MITIKANTREQAIRLAQRVAPGASVTLCLVAGGRCTLALYYPSLEGLPPKPTVAGRH